MSHVPDLPVVSNSTRLVVGIDPGLDQHGVVVLHAATCRRIERLMVPNTIAGMQDLAARMAVWQHYPTPSESAQADPADIVELIRQASHGCVKKEAREAKARDIQHTGKIMVLALGKKDPNRWNVWAEDVRVLARQRCTH